MIRAVRRLRHVRRARRVRRLAEYQRADEWIEKVFDEFRAGRPYARGWVVTSPYVQPTVVTGSFEPPPSTACWPPVPGDEKRVDKSGWEVWLPDTGGRESFIVGGLTRAEALIVSANIDYCLGRDVAVARRRLAIVDRMKGSESWT